jgi:hypothetical protein
MPPIEKNQHRHFNTLLNELKTTSAQSSHPAAPLGYKHLYLIDSFYPSDGGEKIRVTREEKTGVVTQCVRKIRLGNLNIYSPKRAADWRVSVNLEVPGTSHPFLLWNPQNYSAVGFFTQCRIQWAR